MKIAKCSILSFLSFLSACLGCSQRKCQTNRLTTNSMLWGQSSGCVTGRSRQNSSILHASITSWLCKLWTLRLNPNQTILKRHTCTWTTSDIDLQCEQRIVAADKRVWNHKLIWGQCELVIINFHADLVSQTEKHHYAFVCNSFCSCYHSIVEVLFNRPRSTFWHH